MNQDNSLDTLKEIKRIMDRSSRFISLSGLSGISAGIFALLGAWAALPYVYGSKGLLIKSSTIYNRNENEGYFTFFDTWLFWIAVGTFVASLISAYIFTRMQSHRQNIPLWGPVARRLMTQLSIPLVAGGVFLLSLFDYGVYGLIAPGCLIFYGLALVNASKYTLDEIKYLGYCQLILGIINLFFVGYGLYFWAIGFGILHIIYGTLMWRKYERINPNIDEE